MRLRAAVVALLFFLMSGQLFAQDVPDPDGEVDDPPSVEDSVQQPSAPAERPEIPSAWRALVTDSFDDASRSSLTLTSSQPERSQRAIVDGEYQISKLDPGNTSFSSILPGTYRDATVAIDARIVGDIDRQFVIVTCRRQSNGSQYRLNVFPATRQIVLQKVSDGPTVQTLASQRSDAVAPGGSSNRVELTCWGSQIFAVVNGTLVASAQDTELPEGALAVGLGGAGAIEARFDNLVVTRP